MKHKYKVTGLFGMAKIGDVRYCEVLIKDSSYLVYHPPVKGECGSFEICRLKRYKDGEYLVSVMKDDPRTYVNQSSQKDIQHIIDTMKKYKRKVATRPKR